MSFLKGLALKAVKGSKELAPKVAEGIGSLEKGLGNMEKNLERDIAKEQIIETVDGVTSFICPSCNKKYLEPIGNFCSECGQRIVNIAKEDSTEA